MSTEHSHRDVNEARRVTIMNPNIVPRHTPTEEEWKVLATEELTHMSDEDQELLPGEWDEWIAEVRREAYERALAEHSRRQLHIEAMLAEYRAMDWVQRRLLRQSAPFTEAALRALSEENKENQNR